MEIDKIHGGHFHGGTACCVTWRIIHQGACEGMGDLEHIVIRELDRSGVQKSARVGRLGNAVSVLSS